MSSRKVVIEKICEINSSSISNNNLPKYIKYLDTSSITKNKIDTIQILNIEDDIIPSRAKRKVKKGTIIYSTVRPNLEHFGFLENPDKDLIVSTGFMTLDVIDNNIDPKFLYYKITQPYLTDYLHTIASNNVSAYPSINPSDLGELEIEVPVNIEDQQKIASVLSSLDSKIELNNRINEELEAMAKTLYDYWFVQFDFPNAKGKPYKSSGGKMIWNEELKREVPAGWEVETLGDLGNFKNGVNYDPSNPGEIACPIINVRNISATSFFIRNEDLDIIYLRESDVKKYSVHNGSIIIARSGIPGATRLISDIEENTLYCGFAIHYELINLDYKIPIFFYLKSIEQQIQNGSGGTILKNVNQATLNALQISMPTDNAIISKFNDLIQPIFSKINAIQKENQKLTELRDWLLPMLMNGQVKVG